VVEAAPYHSHRDFFTKSPPSHAHICRRRRVTCLSHALHHPSHTCTGRRRRACTQQTTPRVHIQQTRRCAHTRAGEHRQTTPRTHTLAERCHIVFTRRTPFQALHPNTHREMMPRMHTQQSRACTHTQARLSPPSHARTQQASRRQRHRRRQRRISIARIQSTGRRRQLHARTQGDDESCIHPYALYLYIIYFTRIHMFYV
jgi:hypothetical protein